jgi:galactokinase
MHECSARVPPGTSLFVLVASDVPPGAGVSSSAALEVASMAAFAAVLQLDISPRQLAILCQKVGLTVCNVTTPQYLAREPS